MISLIRLRTSLVQIKTHMEIIQYIWVKIKMENGLESTQTWLQHRTGTFKISKQVKSLSKLLQPEDLEIFISC